MALGREFRAFIASEQPETCRFCGARTEFIELTPDLQIHTCPNCCQSYQLEFEPDIEAVL